MSHDFEDEETLYVDRPGYLGEMYGNEISLGDNLGNLAKFDWNEYLIQSESKSFPDRELSVTFDGKSHKIELSTWGIETFFETLFGDLPSMILINDGDGIYVLYKADGFTDTQILAHANSLYEALVSDLEALKS